MRTGALVVGIIGGMFALLYGLFGYGLGSLAGESDAAGILKLLSIGLPIAALVGAGMVKAKPIIGAGLMAVAAVGFVMTMGFNFFSLVPVVLLGIGALLGFLGMQEDAKQSA